LLEKVEEEVQVLLKILFIKPTIATEPDNTYQGMTERKGGREIQEHGEAGRFSN
jgi:hypothetical protein